MADSFCADKTGFHVIFYHNKPHPDFAVPLPSRWGVNKWEGG
jgi:hypothetical protein